MTYVEAVREAVAAAARVSKALDGRPLSAQNQVVCRGTQIITREAAYQAVSFKLPHPEEPWLHPLMALPPDVEVPDSTREQRSAWSVEQLCHPSQAAIGPSHASEDHGFPWEWLRCCTLTLHDGDPDTVVISPCISEGSVSR